MTDPSDFATAADVRTGVADHAQARAGVAVTPRYRVRYADRGDPGAPAVVFVHGLSDRALSYCMVVERLVKRGFRCVGVELADGRADGARLGAYRHGDHARDLVCLFDHLKLSAPDVFASSYGSTVALSLLHQFPGRVRRCVLQGGFAHRALVPAEKWLARAARFLPGRMGDMPGRERAMATIDGPQFAGAAPEAYRFMLRCSGASPIRAVAERGLVLATLDLRPVLPAIRTPVRLIGAARDPIVPRVCEAELEAGLPDAHRVEFAAGGHYPQYVLPGPTAAAVADFLGGAARTPAAGGASVVVSGPLKVAGVTLQ